MPAVQSHLGVISDAAVGESIPDYKTLIYQLGAMGAAGGLWKGPPSILVEDLTYGVRLEDCKISCWCSTAISTRHTKYQFAEFVSKGEGNTLTSNLAR